MLMARMSGERERDVQVDSTVFGLRDQVVSHWLSSLNWGIGGSKGFVEVEGRVVNILAVSCLLDLQLEMFKCETGCMSQTQERE